jgi:hypothetical protein
MIHKSYNCITGGRNGSVVSGRHPTARIFWRHWFSYNVIKKGLYSKGPDAGFERVEKQFE